jgi:hypothetical protein
MHSSIKPILPKAVLPPIPMGCLAAIILFPLHLLILPVRLIAYWRAS